MRRARDLKHPFDTAFQVQDHTLDAMFQVMTKGSEAVHQERVERLRWMKARAKQLEEKEAARHRGESGRSVESQEAPSL